MSEENRPEYHKAPHTLDPNREIPEDAPLSAGNDEEQAEAVKAADEEFTEAVEETPDEEVGPQVPGKPGVQPGSEEDTDDQTSDESDGGSQDVPDGSVNEVLDWVGDDHERAQRALQVERSGQNRTTLVTELEKR